MKKGEVYLINKGSSYMEYRKIINLTTVGALFESLTTTDRGYFVYGYGSSSTRLIEKFIKKAAKKEWYKLVRRYNESRRSLYL